MSLLAISSSAQLETLIERSKAEPSDRKTAEEKALRKACNEFEAVLTTKILKEGMKSAKELGGDDDEDHDKGSDSFREMAYEQIAGFIGRQGTLGLGDKLFNTLKKRLKDSGDGK